MQQKPKLHPSFYWPRGANVDAFSWVVNVIIGVAVAVLYFGGWNISSLLGAFIPLLIIIIRMTFFKKSPQELEKIKKEYEKMDQEEKKPIPTIKDPDTLKDYNKRLYGF